MRTATQSTQTAFQRRSSLSRAAVYVDHISAITPKGSALADTIEKLIDEHHTRHSIERLALQQRLAEARADDGSVRRSAQIASRLVGLAADRTTAR